MARKSNQQRSTLSTTSTPAPHASVTAELLRRELSTFAPSNPASGRETITLEVIESGVSPTRFELDAVQPEADGQRLNLLMSQGLHAKVLRVLKGNVVQVLDRAVRGPNMWHTAPGSLPHYTEGHNQMAVTFDPNTDTQVVMLEQLRGLNPRVADVWRLVTVRILEHWTDGASHPQAVWVSITDLLEAMGYAKKSGGGYRVEHQQQVAAALKTLEELWLVTNEQASIAAFDPQTGSRRPTTVIGESSQRVLNITAKRAVKTLSGQRYPMQWKVQAGDWIAQFPRESATLLKSLVQLDTQSATNIWAKALGMELGYLAPKRAPAIIGVMALLNRAGLLLEVLELRKTRNAARARRYFEDALNLLRQLGMISSWVYTGGEQFANLTETQRLEAWLGASVTVVLTDHRHQLESR